MYLADNLNNYDLLCMPLYRAQNFLKQTVLMLGTAKLKFELSPCIPKDAECVEFSN